MRFFKLIPALAAASALLVLAPAGASAKPLGHKHSSPGGTCRINLFAEPHTITSGESAEIFGQLLCSGGGRLRGGPASAVQPTSKANPQPTA